MYSNYRVRCRRSESWYLLQSGNGHQKCHDRPSERDFICCRIAQFIERKLDMWHKLYVDLYHDREYNIVSHFLVWSITVAVRSEEWLLAAPTMGSWVRSMGVCPRIFVLCCTLEIQGLRRPSSPPLFRSKESYQMSDWVSISWQKILQKARGS